MLKTTKRHPFPPSFPMPRRSQQSGRGLPYVTPFVGECIAFFAEAVQVFGVPKSVGQIYGLLFASPGPLSFSDIVAALEISKGSASQGLQLLRSLGAIKVAGVAYKASRARAAAAGSGRKAQSIHHESTSGDGTASRREYFEPELGLRRLVAGVLRERFEPLMGRGRSRMRHLCRLAKEADDDAARDFLIDRVRQLESWRRQAGRMLPVFRLLLKSPLQ